MTTDVAPNHARMCTASAGVAFIPAKNFGDERGNTLSMMRRHTRKYWGEQRMTWHALIKASEQPRNGLLAACPLREGSNGFCTISHWTPPQFLADPILRPASIDIAPSPRSSPRHCGSPRKYRWRRSGRSVSRILSPDSVVLVSDFRESYPELWRCAVLSATVQPSHSPDLTPSTILI
jgi:hypothetical protein